MANYKRKVIFFFKKRCPVLIFIACVIVWLGGIWIVNYITCTPEKAGVLGDSAGAINALFSSLAFAGVIIAMTLQRKELKLQRSELRLQRKELKVTHEQLEAQKEEFHIQNETLKRQRFENTFFQMMSLQQEIINNLNFSYEEQQKTITLKKEESQYLNLTLHHRMNEEKETQSSIVPITKTVTGRDIFSWIFDKANGNGVRETISKRGIAIYASLKYPEYFDHYFRHLYRIIKFVDESDLISREDKYEYVGMVRATLSRYELVWLFYNCLSENGKDKFKPLVERYAILKNLRTELLVDEKHEELYEKGAYEYTN